MYIKLRGRSRDNDLFDHNAITEIYHNAKDGCIIGFAGYDYDTKEPILLDIELWTGFTDGKGNEFWEHDKVHYPAWGDHDVFTIIWDKEKGCWSLKNDSTFFPMAPIVQDLVYYRERPG